VAVGANVKERIRVATHIQHAVVQPDVIADDGEPATRSKAHHVSELHDHAISDNSG
jgi:hypothetical protein